MDYTDNIDIAKLDAFMKKVVSPVRLEHCAAVSKTASQLAEIYGADVEKARFAGLYHDIAKSFTQEETNRLLRDYGVSEEYYNSRALAHSKLGAAILHCDFNVRDADILSAVEAHTTGRAGMTLLDEILFVADATDATRNYGDVEYYRELARSDIDRACLEIMDFNIAHVEKMNKSLDSETLRAREYMRNKIRDKEK